MCIKIIGTEEKEFDMSEPLESQIENAKEILIQYDPMDPKIDCFVVQVESMVKKGVSCDADIVVETYNSLNGKKLQKKLENLKMKLDVNEAFKGLCLFHSNADKKLSEISEICMGKTDER